jgi:NAD(P)-dependent dehydrogenase (short-subunit alcohol dehydrogenase family)
MKRILVTGANKGIGLAIASAILDQGEDTYVFLGSRDLERGRAAVGGLIGARAGRAERLSLVEIDVGDDASVTAAAGAVSDALGAQSDKLYGIVNNAGIGLPAGDLRQVLEVNTFGVRRVCQAFLPLLDPHHGRVVNITSAAGPMFVSACSAERQRFFCDPAVEWDELAALIDACLAIGDDKAAFADKGLADGSPYGFSKACANLYTMIVAREHPQLSVNACTPGYIATDLTLPIARARGKAPAELGMKPPEEGTRSAIHLLFGELEGNGRYYGSDAKRSPLDRYRSPGDPEYAGD